MRIISTSLPSLVLTPYCLRMQHDRPQRQAAFCQTTTPCASQVSRLEVVVIRLKSRVSPRLSSHRSRGLTSASDSLEGQTRSRWCLLITFTQIIGGSGRSRGCLCKGSGRLSFSCCCVLCLTCVWPRKYFACRGKYCYYYRAFRCFASARSAEGILEAGSERFKHFGQSLPQIHRLNGITFLEQASVASRPGTLCAASVFGKRYGDGV